LLRLGGDARDRRARARAVEQAPSDRRAALPRVARQRVVLAVSAAPDPAARAVPGAHPELGLRGSVLDRHDRDLARSCRAFLSLPRAWRRGVDARSAAPHRARVSLPVAAVGATRRRTNAGDVSKTSLVVTAALA